jgi:hypothetical protein
MTASEPTVRLHINISIEVDEDVDTGIPLSKWNAMTAMDREMVVSESWNEAAQADDGGTWVVTPGAEGV